MIARLRPRLLVMSQICFLLFVCVCGATRAAIGVFNFAAAAVGSALPIQIDYRLNCAGTVYIDICDAGNRVVATLGPYSESAGLHSHSWDNGGNALAGGDYRAVIRAFNDGGSPDLRGTLVSLFPDESLPASIYGLNIDRFVESPAYGTIYVGQATSVGGGTLRAYYADGTPKDWACPNATRNCLSLNLATLPAKAPWGIGIDRLGNIYVACTATGTAGSGVHVYDHRGYSLPYVLQTDPSGIVWLDGLAAPTGLEVFETKGLTVRGCVLGSDQWTTVMDPGITGASIKTQGICLETGGSACYVATSGTPTAGTNPGVTRFVRETGGGWVIDSSFDAGLGGVMLGSYPAARYATGVSCDARDPDGAGPYTASTLWIGLGTNNYYRGNMVRKSLPAGTTTFFTGPSQQARFVAADAVGNVAYESDPSGTANLWSRWCMKAPGGEPSSDVRATNWVTIAAAAERKIVDSIRALKQEDRGTQVELSSACCVTAVFAGCFYIEEADRSCGIKVQCAAPVVEGSSVRVAGTLELDMGERYLADGEIIGP